MPSCVDLFAGGAGSPFEIYERFLAIPFQPSEDIYQSTAAFLESNPTWSDMVLFPPGLSLGGTTWIIATAATIPEPGTLTLALLGSACIGGVQWMGRSRQAARAAKSPLDLVAGADSNINCRPGRRG